jgi:DNA mismatch endonuclease, patch repair protein
MARVKGENTSPERLLRSALWRAGMRYRLNYKTPKGRPDIVFPGAKVAVFVDGCFWHGCPAHYSRPRSSEAFWSAKLLANVERDSRLTLGLEAAGWRVVRVFEHEVYLDLDEMVRMIGAAIRGEGLPEARDWRVVRVVTVPEEGEDWERRELRLLHALNVVRHEVGPRKTGRDKGRPKGSRGVRRSKSARPEGRSD